MSNTSLGAGNHNTECVLTMGWEPWVPYQYVNEDNVLTGYDVELMTAIVNNMNCTLLFKPINWARGLVESKTGELDFLAHADFAEERSQWAHFSDSYQNISLVLYIRKGESGKFPFTSLRDIIGTNFRLAAGRGVNNVTKYQPGRRYRRARRPKRFVT